ncbi:hypothetical protein H0H93_013331, partial [Arthromyces matolae]
PLAPDPKVLNGLEKVAEDMELPQEWDAVAPTYSALLSLEGSINGLTAAVESFKLSKAERDKAKSTSRYDDWTKIMARNMKVVMEWTRIWLTKAPRDDFKTQIALMTIKLEIVDKYWWPPYKKDFISQYTRYFFGTE